MIGLTFDMSVDDLVRESLGEDPKVKALRQELRAKYPKAFSLLGIKPKA